MAALLPLLDVDLTSLEETLAFVDSFEAPAPEQDPNSVGSSSDQVASRMTAQLLDAVDSSLLQPALGFSNDTTEQADKTVPTAAALKKKKKKQRNPANSSTAIQRRRRAELAALREEVIELEAHVNRLKDMHLARLGGIRAAPTKVGAELNVATSASPKQPTNASVARLSWKEQAAVEAGQRQRSELTNRKLKSVLTNQKSVNIAFRALLSKRSVLQDIEFVLRPKFNYRAPAINHSAAVIAQLEQLVEALYMGMGPSTPQPLPKTASCLTEFKQSLKGSYIEMVTTTPMRSSLAASAEIMWRNLTLERSFPDKTYHMKRRVGNTAYEKDFSMLLRDTTSNFAVQGLQFMRKFVEHDRIVIVKSDLILLHTSGLRFRDRTRITISPVASKVGPEGSIVQSRYQVFAETQEGGLPVAQNDLTYAQEFVLQRLSGNTRGFEQMLQSALLTEDLDTAVSRRSRIDVAT